MAYRNLREFLDVLEREGELHRITEVVDPVLEITEITDRVTRARGPALLFERPRGSSIPVVTNLLGSFRRLHLALEVDHVDQAAARLRALLELPRPAGLMDKLKLLGRLQELDAVFPRRVRSGACQQVVRREDFSLDELPILKCWPQDGGRYITWPLVFTKDPETGRRNVGVYRMQVLDARTTAMHWQTQKHGAEHFRHTRRLQRSRLEVAVAIGADPVTCLAGVLPAPPGVDELLLAGFLRKEPVELVRCITVDLEVPAEAEIVLEGYVDPDDLRTEGPFGDHTGFYSLEGLYPAFHLTCITHRRDPVYLTTIVGRPPQEDFFMGYAVGRLFLPLMQMVHPEIVDVAMPAEGIFNNLMIVSIRKSYPGQARKVMHGIWSMGQAMLTKVVVVVDEDVNVHDSSEVVWKALCNIDPQRDIEFVLGPVDTLDHASRLPDYGSKMGIDATRKWPEEGFTRPWPEEIRMDEAVRRRVDELWDKLGLPFPKSL
jgi:4-hydroxy-3-polyprenylbenzoate decarboxylase